MTRHTAGLPSWPSRNPGGTGSRPSHRKRGSRPPAGRTAVRSRELV